MSRIKSLVKNTGILIIGKISTQIVTFLLLPLYTSQLSTYEYGIMDVYVTLASLLIPIITLQIEQAIFRYLISNNKDIKIIISTSSFFVLISLFIYTIIYFLLKDVFSIEYPLIVYLFFLSQSLFQILLQVVRGFNNYFFYSFISFASATMIICLNVLFILGFDMKYEAILLSTAISDFICSIIIVLKIRVYKYIELIKVSLKMLIDMIKYSIPLVINQFSSWLINYSDRLIIIAFLGISANGIYSLANKFFNLPVSLFNIYNLAWTESIIKSMENDDKTDSDNYINKTINITFYIYVCLIIGIVAVLGIVFKFFINGNYYVAYNYIPILLVASLFSGMSATIGSIYVANKKTKHIAITTLMSGILNFVIHFVTIKYIGLYAASISTMITFVILFIYRYEHIKPYYKVKIDCNNLKSIFIIGLIVFIAYYVECIYFQIISLLLLCLFLMYILKTNTDFIEKIKHYLK